MDLLDIAIAKQLAGGGGGSGTDNYNDLSNLPKINDTTLSGNKTSANLGLQSEINSDSKLASDLVDDTNQDNKFVTSAEKTTWNGKQNAIDADHKINADYVDDSTSTNKFVTASDKETWNAKQNAIDNSHKLSSDLVDDTNKTNKFVTSTEKQTWNAKQNAIDADHKLSSSLVSFSEAEAAAIASGIDSSKVGQISTNQTNILSVEDMVCATEFSSSTAYAVGDMVTYEHKLYKFINAHQGAWSASDVQNYDLTRGLAELNAHPFLTIPFNHNMVYRGKNLGDTLTADQDTALSSGNFTNLYLGDYWTKSVTIPDFYELTTAQPSDWTTNYTSYYTKSGNTYTAVTGSSAPTWAADTYYQKSVPSQTITLKAVIADFDTFYAGYASSYAAINTHHAAVIVTGFNNVVWNKTNTTAGGYVNSLIHKYLVGSVLPQIETWFGSAKVLSHQKLLTNAITGDAASGWAWSSQKISLLSENQMYGSKVWGNSKAANGGYEPGEAFKQLNIFNHIDANLLFGSKNIWLRDIASAGWAAYLGDHGTADISDASTTWIAPAALILLS